MKKILFVSGAVIAVAFHFLSFHLSAHAGCQLKEDATQIAHIFANNR